MFYLLPGLWAVFLFLVCCESFGWFDFRSWLWECSRCLRCICAVFSVVEFVALARVVGWFLLFY